MKIIEQIENKCKENGLQISAVFRRANVPQATIQNWRRKEPEAFDKLSKVENAIEELIKEKN